MNDLLIKWSNACCVNLLKKIQVFGVTLHLRGTVALWEARLKIIFSFVLIHLLLLD